MDNSAQSPKQDKPVLTDAEKIAESYNNRDVSEEAREMAKYVQDLYNSGERMWTKEMFRDIEAELAKEPRPHAIMIRSSKTGR